MLTTTPPSTNNFTVGLQNKNSASERIAATQEAQQRIESNKASLNNRNGDASADLGLQDRNTSSERLSEIKSMQQTVIENHGYDAKEYIKNALTNNSKIINTPVLERGSLLDVRI
jgi:hypothetical protein